VEKGVDGALGKQVLQGICQDGVENMVMVRREEIEDLSLA
jgi:hypothetical protein